ncbi:MAG: ABC transporter substrate-binding protein, partial [Hyphomicrobiales bacterium]|nr:ABC transporter substrate-binding protein [Hyphomicrobiales bacterium]
MVTRRQVITAGAAVGLTLLAAPYIWRGKSVKKLKLASSIYVGWMPWFYAAESGLMKKVANRHDIEIEFIRADYADTISLFGAGAVDAVTMTNIDAAPALVSAKIKADAILVGSFSNGNDAIMMRPDRDGELAGKTLGLVEYSVSHYLLDRILQQRGIGFDQVNRLNIADSTMIASMTNDSNNIDGVVTWNPIVDELERRNFAVRFADSSEIPREIADLLVVNRKVLDDTPEFGDALLEIWFEVTQKMRQEPAS